MHRTHLILWIALMAAPAHAEPPEFWPRPPLPPVEARVIEVPSTLLRELAQVKSLVEAEAWTEAVDAMVRLVGESGNELVPLDNPGGANDHYVSVARACQVQISQWPAGAIAAYRGRVDSAARSLLDAAIATRNRLGLEQLVEAYYMSSHGDDAMLALADLLLEAGDYNAARGYLSQLVANPKDCQFVFPDSDLPRAELLARLAMVSTREGSFDRAASELATLVRDFPDEVGVIGGRKANLAQAVRTTLEAARNWPAVSANGGWPAAGGGNARNAVSTAVGDVTRQQWQYKLAEQTVQLTPATTEIWLNGNRLPARPVSRTLPTFVEPLVSGDTVVLEDGGKWIALDAMSGKPLFGESGEVHASKQSASARPAQLRQEQRVANRENQIRPPLVVNGGPVQMQLQLQLRFNNGPIVIRGGQPLMQGDPFGIQSRSARSSVTAGAMVDQLLYAVVTDRRDPSPAARRDPPPNRLLALDLMAEGKLRLEVAPKKGVRVGGPPVIAGNRLYVPLREIQSGGRTSIACYSCATGQELWRTPICSTSGEQRNRPSDVLVAGDGMLYLNTSAGVVVALRMGDGHFAWARTYQRGSSTRPSDLSAVVARQQGACALVAGALVCAPADAAAMFALDPVTGRTLWVNSQAFDVTELLGISNGSLVATGRQMWMLDPITGRTKFAWPDSQGAGIVGSGRGCLAAGELFWPTERAIYVLSTSTGQQTRRPIALASLDPAIGDNKAGGANVVPCGNGLLVATWNSLTLLGSKLANHGPTAPAEPKLGSRPADRIYE